MRYPPDSKSDDEKCMCHMAVRLVKRVEDDDDLEMLKSMDGLTIKPPEWWRQLVLEPRLRLTKSARDFFVFTV